MCVCVCVCGGGGGGHKKLRRLQEGVLWFKINSDKANHGAHGVKKPYVKAIINKLVFVDFQWDRECTGT